MKNIAILGSSGSIGRQALDIIERYPDNFRIIGLACNTNADILRSQIKKFRPSFVSVGTKILADKLAKEVTIPVYHGAEGMIRIATHESIDTVITSVVGSIGVMPTLHAIRARKNIALANKETLVTAGEIIMREIKEHNVKMVPVDSEHSAVFQCLNGENIKNVRKLIITCSGGPFRGRNITQLSHVTAKQALNHPKWKMGDKISIDSATLMNKGFEVIEAHHIYGIPYNRIEVVVHPECIVHSMVEFHDGSIIAQLGSHDMRHPILYSLTHPDRFPVDLPTPSFTDLKSLTFEKPDTSTFRCLDLAYKAGRMSGTMPAALNAANEVAVEFFLKNRIKFLQIQETVEKMISEHKLIRNPSIEQVIDTDREVKEKTREFLERISSGS